MIKPTFHDITKLDTRRFSQTGLAQWDNDGVLHLKNFIPDELIDAYVKERKELIGDSPKWRPGWNGPCPYLSVKSMRDLATYPPLIKALSILIDGDEPGLHLCLTGFQSTERKTHSDIYLNPAHVGPYYVAIWIVLEDVHPDAGPFEYAAGSHRWGTIDREKVWSKMKQLGQDPTLSTWPSDSQDWVSQVCEEEMERRGSKFQPFLGKRGDVLCWNASLLHRGSTPINRELERRALICHFSSTRVRSDMPNMKRNENGSVYFDFPDYKEPENTTHSSNKS